MTDTSKGQVVFTEIPITEIERAEKFYETFLGAPLAKDTNGPNPIWMLPAAEGAQPPGHLYEGKPSPRGEGMTAHFAITDTLEEAKSRISKGGGEVVSEDIDIYVGSFFYALDTEGNSLGVFKYKS